MMTTFVIGIQVFFIIFARVIGFFVASPLWGHPLLLFRFKNLVAILISYILLPLIQSPLDLTSMIPFSEFWFFFIKNMIIGMGVGFFVHLFFAIFNMAGEIWGMQIGFSISQIFDPSTGDQSPVMAQMVGFLALFIFVLLDGPIRLIMLLNSSFQFMPIMEPLGGFNNLLTSLSTGMVLIFKSTIVLSLTIMGSIFVATLFSGLIAKATPQLNVMMFGMQVYVMIGFMILIYLVPNFTFFVGNYIGNMLSIIMEWLSSIGK